MSRREALAPDSEESPLSNGDSRSWRRPFGSPRTLDRPGWAHRSRLLSFPVGTEEDASAAPAREFRLEDNTAELEQTASSATPMTPPATSVARTFGIPATLLGADLAAFAAAVALTSSLSVKT